MDRSRVLVVEDVRHLAHFVRRNLEKAGYETEVVHRGDEVVDAVRRFRPHALLLDMVLPGMSGLEICRALRGDPARENLVIVIVTGHSFDDASVHEVEAAGADWHFTKPLSPVNLLAKLAELGVPPRGGPVAEVRNELATLERARARIAELERERDGLSGELSLAYESLASIYEIGSDPSLLLSPERALRKIIDRALAFEADLHAAVWLRQDGRLVPAQWRNTAAPEPRDPGVGLVGRALRERRGIIVNRREESDPREPELRRARRVAVSPLVCREQAIGALVVWHEAPGEFDSRVMGLLTSLSSHAAMILEQDRLRQETVEGARLRKEVEIGGHIQKTLLFGRVPDDLAGAELGAVAQASRQIDGDFFGFFRQGDRVFDVLVGDVMGKGIPAAIVGAVVKSQFARFAGSRGGAPDAPAAIVSAVHAEVAERLIEVGRFVTAVYARFDLDRGTMTYVDCGHPDTLRRAAAEGAVSFHGTDSDESINFPLGFVPDARYEEVTLRIAPGDVFLFYSDGITEATAPDGAMFGTEGLARTVARCGDLPAPALAEELRRAVMRFSATDAPGDDLTCIVVRLADSAARVLELPARGGRLEEVRDFVRSVCGGLPFDDAEVAELQLALVEAVSNVVRHAYEPGAEGALRIEAERDGGALRFRVIDQGRTFDPARVPAPCFEGTRDGGFGLFIIREVMSEVSYGRDERGNCLELVRRFPEQLVLEKGNA